MVSPLAVDVDGDYLMDLVLSVARQQHVGSQSTDLCAAGVERQVWTLHYAGHVLDRRMALGRPQTAVGTSRLGVPMMALDWNLDSTIDIVLADTDGVHLTYGSTAFTSFQQNDTVASSLCVSPDPARTQRNVSELLFPCTIMLLAHMDNDTKPDGVCLGSSFPRKLYVVSLRTEADMAD